jgi:hypothetical protein
MPACNPLGLMPLAKEHHMVAPTQRHHEQAGLTPECGNRTS